MDESVVILVLGLIFLVFGIIMLFSGHNEETSYYNAVSQKRDLREFVTHDPERPEPGALRVGGWISIAVGVLAIFIWVVVGI